MLGVDLLPPLLAGLSVTVQAAGLGAVGATVLSVTAGLARVSPNPGVRALSGTYVAVFRGTSAVVQLFWVYFALPLLGLSPGAMTAGVTVLALNTGAYGAELVRGAIQAVPQGQWQAARSVGLGRTATMWTIILPQALPRLLAPYGNLLIELCKNSALVSLITLADLTFQANGVLRVQEPSRTPEIFGWTLVCYFVLAQAVRALVSAAERSVRRWTHVETAR